MSSEERSKFGANTPCNVDENEATMPNTSSLPKESSIANTTSTIGELYLSSKSVESVAKSSINVNQNQNANIGKRVIRKVTIIDPKKLQQAGLDRKLAEAIGRQKLKTLAQEQKKNPKSSDTNVLTATSEINPIGNTKVTAASTIATTPITKATTCMLATNSSSPVTTVIKTIPTAATSTRVATVPVITKVGSLKNVYLKSPYQETTTTLSNCVIQNSSKVTETNSPASIQKIFVTPKITITRPVEASSSLRIIPQQRLENVKYILQCKILKKQQLTAQAHQATHNFQSSGATTSSILPNPTTRIVQSTLIEPKIEEQKDFTIASKGKLLKKPSPAKTPQDIARVLDFGSDIRAISSSPSLAVIANKEKEIVKNPHNDTLHIRNSNISTPKESPKKIETVNAHSSDVARLIARIGTIVQQHDTSNTDSTLLNKIPKATIKCEKVSKEIKNKKVSARKERVTKKNMSPKYESVIKQESPTKDIKANSVVMQSAIINQNIKLPAAHKYDNESEKRLNTKQFPDLTQFKDFPIFSPLKQPFPVVTHSQDLPLPTISTFKTPFPTSIIRIGQMPQTQACTNTTSAQKSLIVLENKVLTQDEKIDLTGLGLATPKIETPANIDHTGLGLETPKIETPAKIAHTGLGLATPKIETPAKIDHTGLGLATPKIETPAKIDLTELGLATPKIEAPEKIVDANIAESSHATTSHKVANEVNQGDMASPAKFHLKYTTTVGTKINNRPILSMEKIKLSADQISSLVKAINAKKSNSPNQYVVFGNIKNIQNQSEQTGELNKIKKDISSITVANSSNALTGFSQTHITTVKSRNSSALHTSTSISPKFLLNERHNVAETSLTKENQTPIVLNIKQEHSSSSLSQNTLNMPSTVDLSFLPNKSEVQSPKKTPIKLREKQFREATSETESNFSMPAKTEVLSVTGSQSDTEVQFKNPLPRITQNASNIDNFVYNKSGAYVIDSGEESDASMSAVDFIASLAAEHPITEETKLEISPEELNLNASFSMNFSPLRIPNRDRTDSIKSELMEQETYETDNTTDTKIPTDLFTSQAASKDVQIGKIITISEENMHKALSTSKHIEHRETHNKYDTTKGQGVFKLTESNTKYAESMQQESTEDNMGVVNSLDIIKIESTSGSNVSPIVVKNYELGMITNIEEPQMSPVVVQNLEESVHFGKLSKAAEILNTDAGQEHSKMMPIKKETNIINPMYIAGASMKNINKFENAYVPGKTTANNAKEEIQLDDLKSAFGATENVLQTASGINPLAEIKVSVVEQSGTTTETLKIENPLMESSTESSTPCEPYFTTNIVNNEQINVEEINDANEKSKPVSEDNSNVAPKRLPRLKKGKVNLVPRKKTAAGAQEVKKASPKVSETVETGVLNTKSTEEVNTIREEDPAPNTSNDVEDKINKNFENDCNIENSNFFKAVKEDKCDAAKQLENNNSTVSSAEQATCDVSTSEVYLPISRELKRKTAEISELLAPPKIPKRKSLAVDQELSITSSNDPVEEKIENILAAAVSAAAQKTELTPPQNPFKKPEIEKIVDEIPVKGMNNLTTKFIKGRPSKESDAPLEEKQNDEKDKISQNINTEICLDKDQNVDELAREKLRACNAETVITNQTVVVENLNKVNERIEKLPHVEETAQTKQTEIGTNSQQVNENIVEQNLMQTLPTITENKTERASSNILEPHTKSEMVVEEQRLILNNSENVKPTEPQKSFVNCDKVNVIVDERIIEENNEENASKTNTHTIQNTEDSEKLKSDFLGFDHNSPSTQNIESNLQHLITITNSAEKTKTREENFSTSERESPHSTKGKQPTKSWLTAAKATSNKSKSSSDRRTSTSRRSVPLKKRWEVLRKSEDDLEVSDDLTPADDDDDEDNAIDEETNKAGSLVILKSAENLNIEDNAKKGTGDIEFMVGKDIIHDIVEECEKEIPVEAIETKSSTLQFETDSTVAQNRNIASDEDSGAKKQVVNEIDQNTENSSALDLVKTYKRKRMDHDTKNISASATKAQKGKKQNAMKSTETLKQDAEVINIPAEEASSSSKVLMHGKNIAEKLIPKAKAKRVRKAKSKIENKEFNETPLEAYTMEVTDAHNSLSIMDSANKPEEEITKNLPKEQNTNEKGRGRKSGNQPEKVATTDSNKQPETEQTKSVKKARVRARKTKVNEDDTTFVGEKSDTSKLKELELAEVVVKEEYVAVDKELVVPSLSEIENILEANEKTVAFSRSKVSVIKPNQQKESKQEFTTSTPTLKQPLGKKSKEPKNKGKSLGNTAVNLSENEQTKQTGESKPVVGKKRCRKPKANITNPMDTTVSIDSENANLNQINPTATDAVNLAAHEKTKETGESKPVVGKKRCRKPKANITNPMDTTVSIDSENANLNQINPTATDAVNLAAHEKTKETGESKPVVGKKRCRKPKANLTNPMDTTVSIESENAISNQINTTATDVSLNASQKAGESETPIKVPKKRGRKPKVIIETSENGETVIRSVVDFNERLLLITNRAQLETDEVLTAEPMASTSNTKYIQCGLCLQQMNREMWLNHLATHYGVGWIVGETSPIIVTIRNEVLKAMIAFLKDNEGKYPLTCRMCQRTYRSGLGALMHIEMCGATDNRQKCDYCNQEYSKLTLPTHMRICMQRLANKREEMDRDANEEKEAVFNNVGRKKRVSQQKAEKIIKAIGSDIKTTGIFNMEEAKHYIKFVPAMYDSENVTEKWKSDLETLGKANCPAPDCTFETQDVAAMQSHLEQCELKGTIPKFGVYICKLCDNTTNTSDTYSNAKQAIMHVLQAHKNIENTPDFEADDSDCDIKTDDEVSDDDDVSSGVDSNEENYDWSVHTDDGEEGPSQRKRRRHAIIREDVPERLHPPREYDYSKTARRLWAEFTSQHYSSQPLFTDIKVNYNICSRSEYEPYLPQWKSSIKFHFDPKLNVSNLERDINYGKGRKHIKWSQLQRFEITEKRNEQFLFLGEAIKLLHWVPLPSNIDEQYLLVSTRREYTRTKNPKIANTLLWLYKVISPLQSRPFSMKLHYAINIPEGPVHCMAFLPSGGYDANANRLGLVAIGTPKSTIQIFALPLSIEAAKPNESVEEHSENVSKDFTVIKLQPVWQLTLDVSNKDLSSHPLVDTQCKVLCWSEFSGHAYIFAGYSNGCISYWDITYEMNLNRFIIDGLPNYVPVNFFYTGDRNIHAMALHYDSSGVRLLAVALARRLLYIYDFKRFENPYLLKNEVTRNEVTDLEWSPLWQSVGIAISDALPFDGNTIYAMNPTNIEYKNETIEKLNGNITQIKYNPVQHILSSTTENGDFVILNIREMHLKEIMRESKLCDRAAAIMELKCLDGSDLPKDDPKNRPSDWSFFEKNSTEKYGVVFGPLARMSLKHRVQYRNAKRRPPLNLRHYTRINSLRCNTNTSGKSLFAVGYEKGFVRILNIDRKLYFD